MTIKVTDTIVTTSPSDAYPTHLANLGKGGYRTVQVLTDLDFIPINRKEAGMLVYVIETDTTYKLSKDLVTWVSQFAGIDNDINVLYQQIGQVPEITTDIVDTTLSTHNIDNNAHPELRQFVTSEADRAEQAAILSSANAKIYPDIPSGLTATTEGSYFL